MSYGLMRWILICLVLMASSMCGGDHVRSTEMCHAYNQAWWWECHGLHECCRYWRVTFNWGKHELQHVLWNTAAEHDLLPPENGLQGSVQAWQGPQKHLQDDHSFTEEAEVKVMDWPSMSPDLNPIEHLWGIFKRKVEVRKVSKLRHIVMKEWNSIPVATYDTLVNSMPRRVKAVLDNDGSHTKYWQLTWCMLILTSFPKRCSYFCWQGFSF